MAIQQPKLLATKNAIEKRLRAANIERGMTPGKAAKQAYFASTHPEMRDSQHANKLAAFDQQAKAYKQAMRKEEKKKKR